MKICKNALSRNLMPGMCSHTSQPLRNQFPAKNKFFFVITLRCCPNARKIIGRRPQSFKDKGVAFIHRIIQPVLTIGEHVIFALRGSVSLMFPVTSARCHDFANAPMVDPLDDMERCGLVLHHYLLGNFDCGLHAQLRILKHRSDCQNHLSPRGKQ